MKRDTVIVMLYLHCVPILSERPDNYTPIVESKSRYVLIWAYPAWLATIQIYKNVAVFF